MLGKAAGWLRLVPLMAFVLGAFPATSPWDTVLYGVSYYPEYMPYDRLDKDVDMMRRAGITVVRVGESTWSSWEPREGEFQFAWMERVLDRMQKAGIKAILGTPTYSIPPWLYHKHPEIVVSRIGAASRLTDRYLPTYPPAARPGAYGARQNMDLTNPVYRSCAERIIRAIVGHFKDHPAIIGFQVDNETGSNGFPVPHTQEQFVERLKSRYKTPDALNRLWLFAYWGQLVDSWQSFPPRDGILNPGYKLEWERFQHNIVTDFLGWQAKIVREYKRPEQFITHNFSQGIHTDIDQWAIARELDVAGVNPYYATQNRQDGRAIWLSGDLCRSLKKKNYLVIETNAQSIGWDSRTQFPHYPGQLRLAAYAHLAAGANMVAYWHWHSLHNGQETYWRGILSHDLEPNTTYAEVSRVGSELKRLGPQLVNITKSNRVAILYSIDSYHALSYMPFSDDVGYMTVLNQMYDVLYRLNIEPDFVLSEEDDLSRYKVILVPPLYSASDEILQRLSLYVKEGGHVVMAFKSGFTNEHSTVRAEMAPGPLRAATGIHYQDFTSLPGTTALTPDPFGVGSQNSASVWAEFLVPDTAEVLACYDDPYWKFPAITINKFGRGVLVYEGTVLSDALQREVIRDILKRAGLTGPDQNLPEQVKVRHGQNQRGQLLHYYLNFSGSRQSFAYPYADGLDLLSDNPVLRGQTLSLGPWNLAIVAER
ncbi:MAG TPA: beta-galactosidase [Acidobacteriota bacterium]|nr:beta-galactosidase [Acidobacteriota bacterium]